MFIESVKHYTGSWFEVGKYKINSNFADDDDCGDPEIPRGATVHQLQQTVSNDDSYTREREFICNDGLTLYSGNERTTITCSQVILWFVNFLVSD